MPRIGEYLVMIGAITKEQVNTVLTKQEQDPHKLFGEIACELGFITDEDIDKYFQSQK